MTDEFLSGHGGLVTGRRARGRARVSDALADAHAFAAGHGSLLDRTGASIPRQRVLVLSLERREVANLLVQTRAELQRTRHAVAWVEAPVESRGKFENLNRLLSAQDLSSHDWLLVVDDDVALPPRFLDRFLGLAVQWDFQIAQPAHRAGSHAAWPVTRRRRGVLARRTRFVEIGPLTAFRADTFATLLPFPELRFGWGLDSHWAAVAELEEWFVGVIDAVPITHGLRITASAYRQDDAIAEARAFLRQRPFLGREAAAETLRTYTRADLTA